MATLAEPQDNPAARDRIFFFLLAMLIAVTTFAGFALQLSAGRSSFGAPWWVHLHAITFMGWLAIFATQNALVASGAIGAHRRFGPIAAGYAVWMIIAGEGAMILCVVTGRVPPFFTSSAFLAQGLAELAVFGGLTAAGVLNRDRPDWHRRLMLSATMMLMIPGIERLLPVPLMTGWVHLADWAWISLYAAIGMGYDFATRGRVHPAWLWGVGAITVASLLIEPLGATSPLQAFARYLAG